MTAVLAPAGRFVTAVAELPLRTRAADRAAGAIVVVPGEKDWVDAGIAAAEAGATALVIADPPLSTAADIRRIASVVGVPVIVERPLLRPDVTALARTGDAGAIRAGATDRPGPRILLAEAAASRVRLPAVARDAIGWLRVLAGESLSVVAADGGLALLETTGGIAATLTVVADARSSTGRIRARALGEVITEVELEGSAARVVSASARGRLISPIRFESSERLALRRAVAATEGAESPEDLAELLADTQLVEAILVSTA